MPDAAPAPPRSAGRALFFGAVGAALTAFLVTQAEMVLSSVRIGYLQFPPVALGILLLATMLGRGMKRLSTRWGLSGTDLLIVYCMALVSAMVSSHGVVQKFIPLLVAPKNFATSANGWHQKFDPHILPRMVPYNVGDGGLQNVVTDYFTHKPFPVVPWGAWVTPVLNWGVLIVLVLAAFLCLTAIIRRQWVDGEKLAFPLAQLPLEIAGDGENGGAFFRNPLVWLGALLPVIVFTVKAVHQVLPTVPDVTLQLNMGDYLTTAPYNAVVSQVSFIFSFAAVGFFFLLPADVLFSIWFFFLLTRAQMALGIAYNMDMPGMPGYPPPLFVGYQTMGAYFVLVGYFVWIARPHLRRVWAAAIGKGDGDDASELLPYRVAVWGLLACVALSALWLWGMGMSLWLAVGELVVFLLVIALVMARTTAEAGMLMTETTFRPIDIYRMFAPIHALGAQNLTLLAFVDNLLLRDQRGLLLCGMLDTARIADGTPLRRRAFAGVLAAGIGVALVVAIALNISIPYHFGAGRMDGWMEQGSPALMFQDYAPYFGLNPPAIAGASWQMPTFFSVGVVVTLFLTLMRAAFFWWPLHPLGYAIAGSWSTVQFWFPCLLAWIFKSLTLRYGGMGFYQTVRPFFLGMVIGEFGMAVLSVLLNILFKIPPPAFPWG